MVARDSDRTIGAQTAMVAAAVEGLVFSEMGLDLEGLTGLTFDGPMPPFALLVLPPAAAVGWLLGPAAAAWIVLLRATASRSTWKRGIA